MNTNLKTSNKYIEVLQRSLALLLLSFLCVPQVLAEGSAQTGL